VLFFETFIVHAAAHQSVEGGIMAVQAIGIIALLLGAGFIGGYSLRSYQSSRRRWRRQQL
jgi:hypothetical protein